jgi:predicted phosphodiesterase
MLEDLNSLSSRGSDKLNRPPKEAWRPQLELDSAGGFFVSTPRKEEVTNAEDLLAEFDLDPQDWIVVSVRRSKWEGGRSGEWLNSYRVSLKPRNSSIAFLDATELEKEIKKWRPPKAAKPATGDLTAIYAIGDTQWGKDAGDGTAGTVGRVRRSLAEALLRQQEIKKRGVGPIALPQMGDCIEGVVSQGGKIAGRLDLDLTSQIRVGRRVLLEWVKAFAPLTNELIIPVVPGNHDESHRQLITDPMDSFQVEIVQQVLDICQENPDLQHVKGRFPNRDNSTLAINLSGTMVGFAHGHQVRDPQKWWAGQALGSPDEGVGAADVLITAHYHHYAVKNFNHRLWVQIPAMDGGSAWFADRTGMGSNTPTGIVSMVVGEGHDPRRDLVVLSGEK